MRLVWIAMMLAMVAWCPAQEADTRALGRVTPDSVARAGVAFDPAQSRGVFIGINQYTAPRGVKPPNLKSCVNDAVDLAAAFMDLGLINGPGITLALSGEPTHAIGPNGFRALLLDSEGNGTALPRP